METNLIVVDFKAGRRLIDKDVIQSDNDTNARAVHNGELAGPIERKLIEQMGRLKITDLNGFDLGVYDKIAARYGDNQPKGGVVYNSPIYKERGVTYVDLYGRGCVHNMLGNSRRCGGGYWKNKFESMGRGYWNCPMPFPSSLIDALRGAVDTITIGRKSDAFMWLDRKYKVTLAFLWYASAFGVRHITIDTRSDLVAHDEYLDALKKHAIQSGHTLKVNLIYSSTNEHHNQLVGPGCPSYKRLLKAYNRLADAGIAAAMVKERVKYTDAECNAKGTFKIRGGK